ncbi:MAG: PilZ domain-containing protein [Nitrospira sp.]|nr:MAG: PilZ domain-containing protein [Nitrospira sp.]
MKSLHCPSCGTSFVRVTSNEGMVEKALNHIHMFPFRCQLCTNRFRVFYLSSSQSTQAFDRREFKRLATAMDAQVVDSKPLPFTNRITDISMGGCAILAEGLAKGAFVELILKSSIEGEEIRIETAMVCSVRPESVGIQFLEFRPDEQRRLSQVVLGLLVGQGGQSPAYS